MTTYISAGRIWWLRIYMGLGRCGACPRVFLSIAFQRVQALDFSSGPKERNLVMQPKLNSCEGRLHCQFYFSQSKPKPTNIFTFWEFQFSPSTRWPHPSGYAITAHGNLWQEMIMFFFFLYPFYCPLRDVLYVGHYYRIVGAPFAPLTSQDHECPGVRRTPPVLRSRRPF